MTNKVFNILQEGSTVVAAQPVQTYRVGTVHVDLWELKEISNEIRKYLSHQGYKYLRPEGSEVRVCGYPMTNLDARRLADWIDQLVDQEDPSPE